MHVHAIIRPQSTVHNLWRKQNRTFGALGNNRFVWKGTAYELQELADLEFLNNHPDVQVEIMGKIAPKPVVSFVQNEPEQPHKRGYSSARKYRSPRLAERPEFPVETH